MKLPSKVTPIKRSIIAKFIPVLIELQKGDMSPSQLYKKTKSKFQNLAEFLEVLDCLFLLGKIVLLEEKEVLHYVKNAQE